ncbi:MAG: hypothetical protein IJ438_11945 [Clostridia bacterium]|nr:hypothetical protein [Clostridia bacterium]
MMNREEILARSQKENHNKLDERSKNIQTKANSISQGAGMVMCVLLGAIAHAVTHDIKYMNLAMSLYLSMFAAERICCAVMEKNRGQWVFAGIVTTVAVATIITFLLSLFGIM